MQNKPHFIKVTATSNKILSALVCISKAHLESSNNNTTRGCNNFPIYLERVQCLRMAAKSKPQKNNGDLTRWHHSLEAKCFACLSHWQGRVTHTLRPTTIIQVRRHVPTKKIDPEYTHGCTLSLPLFSLSCSGTIGVSKCQRCIWKAVVITVKAGHQRDATLTLLTCLHQHTWTASLAEEQFSHGTSQNKSALFTHSTLAKKLCSSTHNAYLLYPHREHKNNMLFSWNQKTPESRWKPLFPIDFTC